ncbi:MAG TPA: hypothetical protein DEQ34_13640 [Balneolaceae bacterium]|nr:hypothetical protein [Balneolaceae bacterium]
MWDFIVPIQRSLNLHSYTLNVHQPATNSHLTLLRKLKMRKHRKKESLFIAEGERTVEQILTNGHIEVEYIFMEGDADLFPGLHTNCFSLTKEQMEEASDTDSPQGVLAVCKIPDEATIQTLQEKSGIILAMDAIQDPGNLGTIYRTAAWFGVKAIILGTGTVDLYNSKVVRSTAGATGSVPILTGDLNTILNTFEQSDWKVYLLDGNPGAVSMTKQNFGAKAILVTGNEANGITDSLIQSHRSRMLIDAPEHSNPVESLNAAIATGIALHHVHNSVDNSH